MVPALLLMVACSVERVTGENVPLDPRFYAGRNDGEGQPADPNAGGTGDGPYVGYKGETIHLEGAIEVAAPGQVQIDVMEFDPASPGGVKRAGCLKQLADSGPFSIDIPTTVAKIELQAFQDPDSDGPSDKDPYAEAVVDLGNGAPAEPVKLKLVAGARQMLAQGGAGGGAPGSPGGDPNGGNHDAVGPGGGDGKPSGPPSGGDGLSFKSDGPTVSVSGTVTTTRKIPVTLDFWLVDGQGPGGRTYLGHVKVDAGAWSQKVPANLGPLLVEAYQDVTGDSRTGDDPATAMTAPVTIGTTDVSGIDLAVP
jgi:hypothetical protein